MGELKIASGRGHDTVPWDPTDEVSTENARTVFEELVRPLEEEWRKRDDVARKRAFYNAYVMLAPGKGEQVKEFDPNAGTILIMPPMAGG
jgi:hypothetical protein